MDVLVLGDFYTTDRGPNGVAHETEHIRAAPARASASEAALTARATVRP